MRLRILYLFFLVLSLKGTENKFISGNNMDIFFMYLFGVLM